MKTKFNNTKLYFCAAAALTLLTTVLRSLALVLATDTNGYLTASHPLTVLLYISAGIALAFLLFFPLILKGSFSAAGRDVQTRGTVIGAGLCCFAYLLNFVVACPLIGTLGIPALLWLLGILALPIGAAYFGTKLPLFKTPTVKTRAILGCVALFALACLICFTYFDIATPMNAPRKTHLHLALLSLLLYLLYELRAVVGIPMPRAHAAFSALGFYLSCSLGLSGIVGFAAGLYRTPLYFCQDILLLCFAVYIAANTALLAAADKER